MGSVVGMAGPQSGCCQAMPCVEATGHWWQGQVTRWLATEPLVPGSLVGGVGVQDIMGLVPAHQ